MPLLGVADDWIRRCSWRRNDSSFSGTRWTRRARDIWILPAALRALQRRRRPLAQQASVAAVQQRYETASWPSVSLCRSSAAGGLRAAEKHTAGPPHCQHAALALGAAAGRGGTFSARHRLRVSSPADRPRGGSNASAANERWADSTATRQQLSNACAYCTWPSELRCCRASGPGHSASHHNAAVRF